MGKSKKKHAATSSSSEDSSSSSSDESSDESDSSVTSDSNSSSPEKKARKDSTTSKAKKKEKKKKKKKSKKKKKKSSKFEIEKISPADYYSRNSEFRAWIRSNDKIEKQFADMETKEAKSLFKKFVKKWNDKKLPKEFYRGSITSGGGGKGGFQWGFATNMDAKTKSEIDAVKKGNEKEGGSGQKEKDVVRESSQLEKSLRQMAHGISRSDRDRSEAGGSNGAPKVIGPVMPAHIAQARESSSEDEQEAFERKMQEKRHKDYVKTAEEEFCPKATGFEAKLEKKAMARERKRFRDTSPGLSDKVLFGDSSKMGKAIEKRKVDRAVKQEVSSTLAKEKLKNYAEREKEKMEALLEMAKANKKEGALW